MDRMQFERVDKDGNKVKCEAVATYHDDKENKDYIVYTDNTYDENNKLRVYYSLYEMLGSAIKLIEPKTTNKMAIFLLTFLFNLTIFTS